MMLVNSKEMLEKAKKGHYAVPHFNINDLEWTKYILEKCNELNVPVILGVSDGAGKYMGGYNAIYGMVTGLIKDLNITIPVCLHVDHGCTETCKKALEAGFTSVMIDASKYELDENIRITKEIVDLAHAKGATVEAEVGHIGGTEDNITSDVFYATLEECERLYNETGIDSIAPALGSVHGFYKGEPNLNFERMALINEKLPIPLVLHGGSGIPNEKIEKAIECGISKINVNTELQASWSKAVREFLNTDDKAYDPRKVIGSGEKAMKQTIEDKVKLFKTVL
ncbi:MAG: class II fructose-1,6-bisphosphate aldolase [Bacilli bacterium]|nr:class II fructose-1,6-bisphosphate aldolase [Bacilli bacterium]